jgi:hypothetical protein
MKQSLQAITRADLMVAVWLVCFHIVKMHKDKEVNKNVKNIYFFINV